ncbi:MAG: hypothetical protein AB7J13_01305 [Pyrinomonadaceae bacterium]
MKTKTTQSEPPVTAGGPTETTAIETVGPDVSNSTEETPEGVTLTALQAENADLKAAIRLRDARDLVTAELGRAGARSPELLFESVKGELQFGESGEVQDLAALVATLRKRFPEQFEQTRVNGSIDGGAGQTATPGLTRERLRRMKPSEIAELDWADVRRVLASG